MEAKKIAKLVKALVEAEVAKQQETFLTKTFPKILKEEMKRLNESKPSQVQNEVDPFSLANAVLEEDRKQDGKVYSKNPAINEVLQNTQPFNQMDKTMTFGTQDVPAGGGMTPNLQQTMAQKMGYGSMVGGASKPQGLGVQTGLAGLDRVLNRDNSALVKAFDKNKNWRPGQE